MNKPTSGAEVRRTVVIENAKGLHARAAAKLVQLASDFAAEIVVVKGCETVSAASIMGLIALAATPGTALELCAGPEAEAAVAALAALIGNKFDED